MLTSTELSQAFTDVLSPSMGQQIARTAVLLALLPISVGAGPNCAFSVKGGANDSDAYADGEDIDVETAQSDARKKGALPWATYGGPVAVGDLAQSVAASLGAGHGPVESQGAGALFLEEISDRIDKTAELIAGDLYTCTGTRNGRDALVGLAEIAKAGDSDAYAGLTPSSADYWRALVSGNSGTTRVVTKAMVQSFLQTFIKKDGAVPGPGRKPRFAVTHPDLWLKLKQDIESSMRVTVAALTEVPGPGGAKVALPGGGTAFHLDGTWIVQDPDCPSNRLYAWLDGALKVKTLPKYATAAPGTQFQTLVKNLVGNVEIDWETYGAPPPMSAGGLRPFIDFLAKTGLGTKAMVGVYLQLVCERRNAVGVLSDLRAA